MHLSLYNNILKTGEYHYSVTYVVASQNLGNQTHLFNFNKKKFKKIMYILSDVIVFKNQLRWYYYTHKLSNNTRKSNNFGVNFDDVTTSI